MINNNLIAKNKISKKFLRKKNIKNLSKDFEKEKKKLLLEIDNKFDLCNILNENFEFNFNFKDLKRFKSYKTIAIIGMGGSILGAQAIYHFFQNKIKKKIFFFNDINLEQIKIFKKNVDIDKTLLIVISKSGNTIETLSNFFSINKIKNNFKKNIVIISDKKNSPLFELTKKYDFFYVEHKKFIGGRYSVLSEVGIIPAYFMGIDVKKLRKNLTRFLYNKEKTFLKQSSIFLADLFTRGKFNNLIFLNYSPKLEKFLYWNQQLIAESLGKRKKGFFPVVSNVPKDHHSLLQLYLDGPRDKFFHIFSIKENTNEKIKTKKISSKLNYLNNKKLSRIKESQKNALTKSFDKNNIPYREFLLKKTDEETLGELFSYFILETIFIGKLTGQNPFDQPAVEQVKKLTKKFLFKSPKKNF